MNIVVGVDLVHVPAFEEQLAMPGSRFSAVFSPGEQRRAASISAQGKSRKAEHLAGRWAAKEAFIKAWGQSMYSQPPVMAPEAVDFSEIEVLPDAYGRVTIRLRGAVLEAFGGQPRCSLSISHDGDYATATLLLSCGDSE